ncbi:MAG TPA: 2OG-Fe(II) oxygenase family protein [Actinocrinis sp.]|nr:2OG-Fe(II) oxygenase family protein [Actinocrinis sp.]
MTSTKTTVNLPIFRFRDQAEERREVLRTAGETVGAVLVVDLAPLCELAGRVAAAVTGYFDLDHGVKAAAAGPLGRLGHGWSSDVDAAGRPTFERLSIARFDDAGAAAAAGVGPEHLDLYEHTNVWPDGALRDLVDRFRTASAIVCEDLLRETAKAVGLPANTFVAHGPDHTDVALTRYAPRDEPGPGEPDEFGYAPHRDSTFVSLLSEHGEGGCLQVHDVADDSWITAAPKPGSLVFIFGTLVERRTGGLVRAGRHRVLSPVKAARTSASVFYNASLTTSVLPGSGGPEPAPAPEGLPATVGEVYRGLLTRPAL